MSKHKDRHNELRGHRVYGDYPGSSFSGEPGLPYRDRSPMTNQGYRAYQDYGYSDRVPMNGPNHSGKGPKGYRRSDEKIYDEVCEVLTTHYEVDATDIEVEVKDGIVTLDGSVDSRRTKRLAEDIVGEINGVVDVRNNLILTSHEQNPQQKVRSPRESTDSELGR